MFKINNRLKKSTIIAILSILFILSCKKDKIKDESPKETEIPIEYIKTMSGTKCGLSFPIDYSEFWLATSSEEFKKEYKCVDVLDSNLTSVIDKGFYSVSGLLKYLDDTTSTGVMVNSESINQIVKVKSFNTTSIDPENSIESYNLKVGDICYVLLGQIVNRNYSAIKYQPTAIILVNSPTDNKELCDSIRNTWSGLTLEQHRKHLKDEANDGNEEAKLRLNYYYGTK